MPPKEKEVPTVEVRWLAHAPSYPHEARTTVSLPDDSELAELLRMGWCVKEEDYEEPDAGTRSSFR